MDIIQRSLCNEDSHLFSTGRTCASKGARLEHVLSSYASISGTSLLLLLDSTNLDKTRSVVHATYTPSVSQDTLLSAVGALPPDEVIRRLCDAFFLLCGTNHHYINHRSFVLDLEEFLEAKKRWKLDELGRLWKFVMILLGVLANACGFEYLVRERTLPSVTPSMVGLEDPGLKYYRACVPFIGDIIASHDLKSAQALLLLGLFLTTVETSETSMSASMPSSQCGYLYFRTAVEISITIRLHLILKVDTVLDESNLRFWWSCYCLERRYGVSMGKKAVIDRANITSRLPSDTPELRIMNGLTNYTLQRSLVELMFIIDRISSVLCPAPLLAGDERYIGLDFAEIRKFLNDLEQWRSLSPASLQPHEYDPADFLYRPYMHLILHYFLAKLYLGKPFLLFRVESINQKKTLGANEDAFISHLMAVGVDAAVNMIDILLLLESSQKLGLYSSTDLTYCNLSLFVIAVAMKIDRSAKMLSYLKKGLGLLKTMSRGCAAARVAYRSCLRLEQYYFEETRQDTLSVDPREVNLEELDTSNYHGLQFFQESIDSFKLPKSIAELEPFFDESVYNGGSGLYDDGGSVGVGTMSDVSEGELGTSV